MSVRSAHLPSYRCSIDTQGHPGRSLALALSMMRTSSRTSRELCHRWLRSQTTLVDSWASYRLGVTLREASGYTDIYSVQATLISCTMLPGDRTSTTLDHAYIDRASMHHSTSCHLLRCIRSTMGSFMTFRWHRMSLSDLLTSVADSNVAYSAVSDRSLRFSWNEVAVLHVSQIRTWSSRPYRTNNRRTKTKTMFRVFFPHL